MFIDLEKACDGIKEMSCEEKATSRTYRIHKEIYMGTHVQDM